MQQEGSLCAQHCLNALLQNPYFTAVDLADLGRGIDEEERCRMAEGGIHSEDYQKFLQVLLANVSSLIVYFYFIFKIPWCTDVVLYIFQLSLFFVDY